MAPTICFTDHNGTSVSETSCPRSRLKCDRVSMARRKRKEINQSSSIAATVHARSTDESSSNSFSDKPNYSCVPEVTLPNSPEQRKPKIVYKNVRGLCDLLARTKSLALRNYVFEVMLEAMQRTVQNLPQSSENKLKNILSTEQSNLKEPITSSEMENETEEAVEVDEQITETKKVKVKYLNSETR